MGFDVLTINTSPLDPMVIFDIFHQRSYESLFIKPYEGTILTSGKACCVQYCLVFCLISGYTIASFVVGSNKTLASQSRF